MNTLALGLTIGTGLRVAYNACITRVYDDSINADRVSRARGLARGLIITNMLREWAGRRMAEGEWTGRARRGGHGRA